MTELFEHRLITEGWRSLEAKTKKKKERSCWINPEGHWYNCPFAEHQIFAYYVVKDIYKEECNEEGHSGIDFENAGDILRKEGWILIHHDPFTGTVINGFRNMNIKQYKVLYAYFGNERLFRGWTITLLYKEAQEGNKDDRD